MLTHPPASLSIALALLSPRTLSPALDVMPKTARESVVCLLRPETRHEVVAGMRPRQRVETMAVMDASGCAAVVKVLALAEQAQCCADLVPKLREKIMLRLPEEMQRGMAEAAAFETRLRRAAGGGDGKSVRLRVESEVDCRRCLRWLTPKALARVLEKVGSEDADFVRRVLTELDEGLCSKVLEEMTDEARGERLASMDALGKAAMGARMRRCKVANAMATMADPDWSVLGIESEGEGKAVRDA
eukprot:3247206-Rhodomonas_salina.1